MPDATILILSGSDVRALLGWDDAIALVRDAMIALSAGTTRHLPRAILAMEQGRAFGLMAGGLAAGPSGEGGGFGAKLISVYPENHGLGRPSHQGAVLLHDAASGALLCIADAAEITRIRTAAASAVATAALSRPESRVLAILGYGAQAHAHAVAIARVRAIDDIRIWGRDPVQAQALAARLAVELGVAAQAAAGVAAAVADADVVCATTAAAEPILFGRDIAPGTHVNLVGSSRDGPAEADGELVAMSRFIADCSANVIAEGAEYRNARAAGRIGDGHIAGEIGAVLAGRVAGRTDAREVTVYKSLGHIVQDLAAIRFLDRRARAAGRGVVAPF